MTRATRVYIWSGDKEEIIKLCDYAIEIGYTLGMKAKQNIINETKNELMVVSTNKASMEGVKRLNERIKTLPSIVCKQNEIEL